jgi:hypothetical protein
VVKKRYSLESQLLGANLHQHTLFWVVKDRELRPCLTIRVQQLTSAHHDLPLKLLEQSAGPCNFPVMRTTLSTGYPARLQRVIHSKELKKLPTIKDIFDAWTDVKIKVPRFSSKTI